MKYFTLTLTVILLMTGCRKDYDDSELWNNVNNLKSRIEKLETICNRLNTNIVSLQTIIEAIQKNDAIKDITTLSNGEGYMISFTSGESITIFHGKDGVNGTNGKDGTTPNIGVKQDSDGIYYWTINGTWLLDSNNEKTKAVGVDGSNGKDGITPVINVKQDEDGMYYWTVNNVWLLDSDGNKIKAVGTDGSNGQDGDNLFQDIVIKDGYAYFTLNDNEKTILQIPFYTSNSLIIHVQEEGTLKKLLTNEQKRTILTLKLTGTINEDDMKAINAQMLVLEKLDLSETTYNGYGSFSINPYGTSLINRTLREIILPSNGNYDITCDYCLNLEKLTVTKDYIGIYRHEMCENLNTLTFAEGVTKIKSFIGLFPLISLPTSIRTVNSQSFSALGTTGSQVKEVICNAIIPPLILNNSGTIVDGFDDRDWQASVVLKVPFESLELYQKANGWKQFDTIIAIDK